MAGRPELDVSAVPNPAAKIAALEVAAEHNKPGMAPHTLFFPDATEAFLTFNPCNAISHFLISLGCTSLGDVDILWMRMSLTHVSSRQIPPRAMEDMTWEFEDEMTLTQYRWVGIT